MGCFVSTVPDALGWELPVGADAGKSRKTKSTNENYRRRRTTADVTCINKLPLLLRCCSHLSLSLPMRSHNNGPSVACVCCVLEEQQKRTWEERLNVVFESRTFTVETEQDPPNPTTRQSKIESKSKPRPQKTYSRRSLAHSFRSAVASERVPGGSGYVGRRLHVPS